MNAIKSKVMFVDDEEAVRVSWNRFLSDEGFDVTTATDGAVAISELRENPVDVVVSDLRMPTIDGLELLSWLREEQPDTRFIMLTGYGTEEVERRVRELGAFDYLDKPISPETLAAVVTAATHLKLMNLDPVKAETAEVAEQPVEEVVEAVAETAEPAKRPRSKFRESAEIVGGLVAAPVMGLAFVIFLPVVGFVGLMWYAGRALVDIVAAQRG
jgi:CheY-like chemotaxis protein